MKTLLILGAGRWQMPLIAKAKAMGFRTFVMDQNPSAPGFGLADISWVCDIRNPDEILNITQDFPINGVVCDQTEVSLLATSTVAKALKLPHVPEEVLFKATNKFLMREAWKEAHVSIPRYRKIHSIGELQTFTKEIGFPVVTKPLSSSGSQGVCISNSESELKAAFEFALSFSKDAAIIAEEFVDGREYTVEAYSFDGAVHILAVSQKFKPQSQFQVSTLLEYPPDLTDQVLAELEKTVKQAVSALGIKNGPSHSEVLLSKNKPVMVETAARGGGFGISSGIIKLCSGFDQTEALIKNCLGEKVSVPSFDKNAVTLGFFQGKPGKVISIKGIDQALRLRSLYALEFFVKPGDTCRELSSDRQRAGMFVLSNADKTQVRKDTQLIYELIQIHTES